MIWGLLGLILVLVLIGVAFTNSNAGRVLPVALAMVIGIIGYLAWYQNHELDLSKRRIPVAEVELADMKITHETRGRQVTGRVRNHSQKYTLTELQLRVSMEDCAKNGHCEVINQTDITLKPEVPPGQARDFREPLYLSSPLAPRGKLVLHYAVMSTRGE
ncbi:MAG: hypothetical protein P8164_02820 [Gammaproteobacteria bacterium]|jgi:hypothetical protein